MSTVIAASIVAVLITVIAVLGVTFLIDMIGTHGTHGAHGAHGAHGTHGAQARETREGFFLGDNDTTPAPGSALPASTPSFLLNERGTSLTCSTLLGNVNRYGRMCGLPSSIVAHWKLDSVSVDGTVYDLSSNALHLRALGAPQLRHDEGRSALWLDGARDRFALKNAPSSSFMRGRVHGGFTLSFWFKKGRGNENENGGEEEEPLLVLHDGSSSFAAVTMDNKRGGGRVSVRTSGGGRGGMATASPTSSSGGDNRWTHGVAVFAHDSVRLVLSRARLGDVSDNTQEHDLSRIDYAGFRDVAIGGSDLLRGFFRGGIHDVRVHARPIDDGEMEALLHLSANEARETVANLEVRGGGDALIRGNANVQHRLHFKDPKMDPSYDWNSNNSDTYFFEKQVHDRNRSSLDLTINDDANERFRILGNACREGPGGCSGPGVTQHEFRADGRAYHKGDVVAAEGGIAQAQGDAFRLSRGGTSMRRRHRVGNNDEGGGGIDMGTAGVLDIVRGGGGGGGGDRRAFRFDARNDRFCVGGQCMAASDVQRLTRDVHLGDLRVRGDVRADGALLASGNVDVRNPGGGGNHDGRWRLRTFYRGTDTHLSLEEYDDDVSYDMKTHAGGDGGDTASLVKTRAGDVYIRNRNGFIKLGSDGTVDDSGYKRLCIGSTCVEEADLRRLVEASGDLSDLDARFASKARVADLNADAQQAAASAAAAEPERTLATIYRHCGFEGPSSDIKEEGRYDIDFVRKNVGNDNMSSVRVADGYQVRLFRHAGFRGNSVTLRGDESCLVFNSDFANDVASSLIVEKRQ